MGAAMIIGGVIGSSAMGGYTAYKNQQALQQGICEYVNLMKKYQDAINTEYSGLTIQYTNLKNKVHGIQSIISSKQQELNDSKTAFKTTYSMTILSGIIFLCIITFLLGTKRFILGK